MKVLVTGGSGFIGHAVLSALSSAHPDWQLYNLDVRPPRPDPSLPPTNAHHIPCDITSLPSLTASFLSARPDLVVHTAGIVPGGQSRYSRSPSVRKHVHTINVQGTANVLSACATASVLALVYTSSCTVISDDQAHDYPLMSESLPLGNATLVYGATKAEAETLVLRANTARFRTCALRPATVIGPGDSFGVIGAIYACVRNGETPFVIVPGDNLYDFVFFDNVAHAHLLAVENLLSDHPTAAGLAMFVSNQEPVYFRDFMEAVWALCGGHVAPFRIRVPAGLAWCAGLLAEGVSWITGREAALSRGSVEDAVGTRYSSNARARRVLGYQPLVGFAEAVRISCEDWKRVERDRSVGKVE